MTNDPRPGEIAVNRPRGLEALAAYRSQILVALFVVAALLAGTALALGLVFKGDATEVVVWVSALAVIFAGGGLFYSTAAPTDGWSEPERLRILILALGGLVGVATVILGAVLPFTRYLDAILGGMKSWHEHAWGLTGCAAAVFGGLVLTFVSLQLARGMERSSSSLRQLLYGYNAALGSFLLLTILVLFNILPYGFAAFNNPIDWSESNISNLSDATRNLLSSLKQPIKVIAILQPRTEIEQSVIGDVYTLLKACQEQNKDNFKWESMSRDMTLDDLRKLVDKYPIVKSQGLLGLLVLYGPEQKAEAEFVPLSDLYRSEKTQPGEPQKYTFLGEAALTKALRFLSEGKTKPVLYFTQGQGEPSLEPKGRLEEALDIIRDRLRQRNYEVRPLRFGPDVKNVPSDAALIIIVRPTSEFTPTALRALREYMDGTKGTKGKLLVLSSVVLREGAMVRTGLESLLENYGVRLGDDRILDLNRPRYPTLVSIRGNDRSSNPVAQMFSPLSLTVNDVRSVTASSKKRPEAVIDELCVANETWIPIVDTQLAADPRAVAASLLEPQNRARLLKQHQANPNPSVAVAVSESANSKVPRLPGHEGLFKDVPRLVVFGSSGWISDEAMESRGGTVLADLFASCVSWLQGRSDIGPSAEGKSRKEYIFNPTPDTFTQMRWLPLGLLLLTVVGLGCGVWVVRRR